MCVETGVEYQSAVDAANTTGISKHHIWANARGARKDAGGYQWVYLDQSKRGHTKMPESYRQNKRGILNGRAKPIRCVETGEIFLTGRELAKRLGLQKTSVSVFMGRNKMHNGLHYEFIEKGEQVNGNSASES